MSSTAPQILTTPKRQELRSSPFSGHRRRVFGQGTFGFLSQIRTRDAGNLWTYCHDVLLVCRAISLVIVAHQNGFAFIITDNKPACLKAHSCAAKAQFTTLGSKRVQKHSTLTASLCNRKVDIITRSVSARLGKRFHCSSAWNCQSLYHRFQSCPIW